MSTRLEIGLAAPGLEVRLMIRISFGCGGCSAVLKITGGGEGEEKEGGGE